MVSVSRFGLIFKIDALIAAYKSVHVNNSNIYCQIIEMLFFVGLQAVFWQSYFHAQKHPNASPDECVGEEVPDDLMDKLEVELQYGSVLTHLYWTLWSFRQGLISAIDFGYMEYGIDRLERYLELKAKLPPLV